MLYNLKLFVKSPSLLPPLPYAFTPPQPPYTHCQWYPQSKEILLNLRFYYLQLLESKRTIFRKKLCEFLSPEDPSKVDIPTLFCEGPMQRKWHLATLVPIKFHANMLTTTLQV